MKMGFVINVLILLMAGLVQGQTQSPPPRSKGVLMTAGGDAYHAQLKLTTSIVDQIYCSDGRIRYSLLYKFTNVGKQTVVLSRFRPIVAKYVISANEQAAMSRKHEAVAHILSGLSSETTTLTLDEKHFIVLKTGEAYEVKDDFSLSIENENGKPLRPGTHMLQVIVQTWPYAASNIEWREKWNKTGYLWSDSLLSDAMPFVIAKQPTVSDCK